MTRARADPLFDRELAELPPEIRWREWMGRVEALIFASPDPVPREKLAALVGPNCRLDELIADIQDELRARPYELAFVAGGWQHRTRPRYADAIRDVFRGASRTGMPDLSRSENLIVTAIAYLQPVTRLELSRLVGKEVSRDLVARLKRLGLVAAGPRVPAPGAPLTYVTTGKFLSVFGLGSLRDLPDLEQIENADFFPRASASERVADEFDDMLGLENPAAPFAE